MSKKILITDFFGNNWYVDDPCDFSGTIVRFYLRHERKSGWIEKRISEPRDICIDWKSVFEEARNEASEKYKTYPRCIAFNRIEINKVDLRSRL